MNFKNRIIHQINRDIKKYIQPAILFKNIVYRLSFKNVKSFPRNYVKCEYGCGFLRSVNYNFIESSFISWKAVKITKINEDLLKFYVNYNFYMYGPLVRLHLHINSFSGFGKFSLERCNVCYRKVQYLTGFFKKRS